MGFMKQCYISHLLLLLILNVLLVEINECESSPCANEATCDDIVNGYECQCVTGFVGANCETGTKTQNVIRSYS